VPNGENRKSIGLLTRDNYCANPAQRQWCKLTNERRVGPFHQPKQPSKPRTDPGGSILSLLVCADRKNCVFKPILARRRHDRSPLLEDPQSPETTPLVGSCPSGRPSRFLFPSLCYYLPIPGELYQRQKRHNMRPFLLRTGSGAKTAPKRRFQLPNKPWTFFKTKPHRRACCARQPARCAGDYRRRTIHGGSIASLLTCVSRCRPVSNERPDGSIGPGRCCYGRRSAKIDAVANPSSSGLCVCAVGSGILHPMAASTHLMQGRINQPSWPFFPPRSVVFVGQRVGTAMIGQLALHRAPLVQHKVIVRKGSGLYTQAVCS
jgi:hypothetical protein